MRKSIQLKSFDFKFYNFSLSFAHRMFNLYSVISFIVTKTV